MLTGVGQSMHSGKQDIATSLVSLTTGSVTLPDVVLSW